MTLVFDLTVPDIDWLPIVTLVLGAVFATGGSLLGQTISDRRTERREVAARRFASNEADRQREQSRLEQTYIDLLRYISWRRIEALKIRPFITYKDRSWPEIGFTEADAIRVQSLAAMYASDTVNALVKDFHATIRAIQDADIALSGIDEQERQTGAPVAEDVWGGTSSSFGLRLFNDQQRLAEHETKIAEQIRAELSPR